MRRQLPMLISMFAGFAGVAAVALAQTPTPIDGSDVILDAAGSSNPTVASNANGVYVAVWLDSGVKAQRRNADGTSAGSVLSVGTGQDPAVAVADSGAFLVVWRVNESGTWKVKKRFYSAADAPTAAADVDADTDGLFMGDVANDASGNFVVTWSENVGSYDYDVRARRYDNTGELPSAEQTVSSGAPKDLGARIAYSAGAQGFLVVWDRDDSDIRARGLNAAGVPTGSDFAVNTYTTGLQIRADVARSREGSFVVAWDGAGSGDVQGVFARRFDAAGAPAGDQFLVNSYTTNSQQRPRVAMDASSNFIVTWTSIGSPGDDNSDSSAQARAFFADGSGLGSQFQVNGYTTQIQSAPDVAMLGGGEFVIAWQRQFYVMPTTTADVRQRRFASELPLFADGFESGNRNAWSSSAP